jgi:hypothetical protein
MKRENVVFCSPENEKGVGRAALLRLNDDKVDDLAGQVEDGVLLVIPHNCERELLAVAGARHTAREYAPAVSLLPPAAPVELHDGLAGVGAVRRVGRLQLGTGVRVPND